ncbi:MAG: T9SS type A sorting domain-containing protein [Hyphomicrobiales bacterium]
MKEKILFLSIILLILFSRKDVSAQPVPKPSKKVYNISIQYLSHKSVGIEWDYDGFNPGLSGSYRLWFEVELYKNNKLIRTLTTSHKNGNDHDVDFTNNLNECSNYSVRIRALHAIPHKICAYEIIEDFCEPTYEKGEFANYSFSTPKHVTSIEHSSSLSSGTERAVTIILKPGSRYKASGNNVYHAISESRYCGGSRSNNLLSETVETATTLEPVTTFSDHNSSFKDVVAFNNSDNQLLSILKVFPNPFTNTLTINAGSGMNDKEVRIFDCFGKMVKQARFNTQEHKLDMSSLSKGMYIVKVFEGSDILGIEKVVKQ